MRLLSAAPMARETAVAADAYSDRALPPEVTFARIVPLLAAHGITRIGRQTGLDCLGIPVWTAIRPNSLSLAVNQGKGVSDDDARISAVMEAVERAVAGEPGVGFRTATHSDLLSEGLAADRLDGLLARGGTMLGADQPTAWIEGYDLLAERSAWIPRDAVLLDRTTETRYWQSSDGLASGNTLVEAVFHGLLERVERDAETLWSLENSAERARRCIDPTAFADGVVDDLVTRIRRAGLRLQVFDLTSDIGIPCFQALIGPDDVAGPRSIRYAEVANGSGCHPDPVRAAIRALTEAAQSRLTLISGSRDDIAPDSYDRPLPRSLIEDFSHEPAPSWRLPPAVYGRSLAEKLGDTIEALRRRSVRSAIAVPLSTPNPTFAVVKMIVPDLENPPGARQARFGARALAKMMSRR